MRYNILISGLGGSLFPYLNNKLKDKYNIFYIDSNKYLKNLYPDLNLIITPLVNDKEYEGFIKNIIKDNKIHYYLPLIDEEIILAKKLEKFQNVKVISPTLEFSNLCLNKYELMHSLSENNISYIPSYLGHEFKDQLEYPIFVKPNSGRGSRGIKMIKNPKQLEAYHILEQTLKSNTLIQPLLTGTEYTVGVNVDSHNRILSICSKKVIEKKGITKIATIENNVSINSKVLEIVKILNPCGPFNVQLIMDQLGDIKIFEINPRFSTTTIMEYFCELDLIEEYITYSLELSKIPLLNIVSSPITLHRRWENVFYYEN